MTVQAFYNSIRPLSTLAGVVAALVAPVAKAADFAGVSSLNPLLQSNPVRLLPETTLFMTTPPTPSGAGQTPKISDVIGKAFNHDDLNGLYGAGSFGACETSSRIPSHFEKNFSNFAYGCMENFKDRHARDFDERFQANPHSQGVAVAPLGGGVKWTNISADARQRLLQRSIHDLAKRNQTLSDILQGRISIDVGLSTFGFDNKTEAKKVEAPRPRYVVEVDASDANPELSKKRTRIASVGRIPDGSVNPNEITSSTSWMSEKPRRAKRVLRETFEETATDAQVSSESAFVQPSSDAALAGDSLSQLKYLSRQVGLAHIPFTRMNMRAERRVVEGQNQFALRITESQDLFFAEFPDARKATPDTMVWGYKIPVQRHALNIRIDEMAKERTTSYSYRIDDSNKTDLSFNHKSKAVSAGFVVTF